MSLPESHPPSHEHKGLTCPVTGEGHGFCPSQKGDLRSPCPALNTMANHGYISRDGKNLGPLDLARGLRGCYGLSKPLAYFLAYGTYVLLRKFRRISLHDVGIHNVIEHDASLVHHDTPEGQMYAPIEIDQNLVEALIDDVKPSASEIKDRSEEGERFLMSVEDVARARNRREDQCRPISEARGKIARGEMAIILGVWESRGKNKSGIPVDYIREWIGHERMPDGWKPDHEEGLLAVIKRDGALKAAMDKLRAKESKDEITLEKKD